MRWFLLWGLFSSLLCPSLASQDSARFPRLNDAADRKAIDEMQRLEKTGRIREAGNVLKDRLRNTDHPFLWFTLGNLRCQVKDYSGAETAYRKALRTTPDHAATLRNLAIALIKQNRRQEAVKPLTRALKSGGMGADLLLWLAEIHLKERQDVEASLATYRKALLLAPDNPDVRVGLIIALRHKGNMEEAVRTAEQALKVFPFHTRLTTLLADSLIRKGDYGTATDLLEMLRILGIARPADLLALADLYFHARLFREASQVYGQAHAAGSRDAKTRLRWGLALYHDDRKDRAASVLENLVKEAPENGRAWFRLGKIRQGMHQYEEALAAYSKAVDLLKKRGEVFLEIASIHLDQNRFQEAEAAFLHAAEDSASEARAWKGLGDVAGKQGKISIAIRNYHHALQLDPSSRETRRALSILENR